ncbi:unnamed protein product [Cyclocybe aegerita]|uniref:Uncharacterized protein n=1 Tax=Cyclocybe aegerita TaxID=1973307 RepID=A0A8S0XF82_CYCAE|nr:unnamed protein product [Cyclocybe aegerita]
MATPHMHFHTRRLPPGLTEFLGTFPEVLDSKGAYKLPVPRLTIVSRHKKSFCFRNIEVSKRPGKVEEPLVGLDKRRDLLIVFAHASEIEFRGEIIYTRLFEISLAMGRQATMKAVTTASLLILCPSVLYSLIKGLYGHVISTKLFWLSQGRGHPPPNSNSEYMASIKNPIVTIPIPGSTLESSATIRDQWPRA